MSIIWTIIIGFVAGVIAKLLHPGPNEPLGFILTTVLGIAGAFVATYLGQAIGWYQAGQSAGFIGQPSAQSSCWWSGASSRRGAPVERAASDITSSDDRVLRGGAAAPGPSPCFTAEQSGIRFHEATPANLILRECDPMSGHQRMPWGHGTRSSRAGVCSVSGS